ncbi:MAG: hypothetical protein ABWY07_03055 [Burkholderiales bacterium]
MPDAVYRRYVLRLLGATLGLILLAAAFNRVVDPFWYFRDVEMTGFNAVKTSFRRFERNVKPAILLREQPEAVILGSSYAEIGLDPLHPRLTDGGRARSFNFALAGAPWQLNFCALEFVLSTTRAERIVLGIHAGALPDFDCTADLARMKELPWAAMLLSATALGASIQTVKAQKKAQRATHTRHGLYFHNRFEPGAERRFREHFLALQLPSNPACRNGNLEQSPATPAWSAAPGQPMDLDGLDRIVKAISGRDVALKLVIYPQHALRVEIDYLCERAEARWQALWQIAQHLEIHPPAPPASIEVWDFQGYSRYTTEPVASGRMVYWQDPEHFNYEFGNVMLDWMFGALPIAESGFDGLGYRATTETLAARRAWFEEQRAAYLRAHPDAVKTFGALLPPGLR